MSEAVKQDAPKPSEIYFEGEEATPTPEVKSEVPVETAVEPKAEEPKREREKNGRFKRPDHPESLVFNAQAFGFSEQEIDELSTKELDAEVRRLQRMQKFTEQPRQEQVREPEVAQEEPINLGLDEFEYPEQIVSILTKQAEQIRVLEKKLAGMEGHLRNQHAETVAQKVDRVFSKRAELFGDQPIQELDAGSSEFRRRMAIMREVDQDKSKRPIEAKVNDAIRLLFGDGKPAAKKEADVDPHLEERRAAQEKRWNDAALARPTSSTGVQPKGDRTQNATSAVAALLNAQREDQEPVTTDEFI